MAPDMYDLIMQRLDTMESNMRDDVGKLHDKLNALGMHGCAHRTGSDQRVENLERRVAALAKWQDRQTGAITILAGLGGFAGAAIAWVGRAIVHRVSNGA